MSEIQAAELLEILGRWWFNYDEGNFDVLTSLLTQDAHFTCRTDTGTSHYEEFARADYQGRDAIMAWQTDHRLHSPYPLRHNGTNAHIVARHGESATFSSYIFVSQITESGVSPLSSAIVTGKVRRTDSGVQISALHVALDTMISLPLLDVQAAAAARSL